MKELLTEWIVNLTFFSLLTSLFTKMLPGKSYIPYIKVICGIMIILILLQPILKLTGLENVIHIHLAEEMYEIEKRQMENELIRMEEEQRKELEQRYQEYLEELQHGLKKQNERAD